MESWEEVYPMTCTEINTVRDIPLSVPIHPTRRTSSRLLNQIFSARPGLKSNKWASKPNVMIWIFLNPDFNLNSLPTYNKNNSETRTDTTLHQTLQSFAWLKGLRSPLKMGGTHVAQWWPYRFLTPEDASAWSSWTGIWWQTTEGTRWCWTWIRLQPEESTSINTRVWARESEERERTAPSLLTCSGVRLNGPKLKPFDVSSSTRW